MNATFLDGFDVLLLDMNGTFMFGHDRFGPDVDYFATYVALGGTVLDRAEVNTAMEQTFSSLITIYHASDNFDSFPTLGEVFRLHGMVPEAEVRFLERVFAFHELGHIPESHETVLRRLAATHKLGVLSNLFSHPDLWFTAFPQSAVFRLFHSLTFSSQSRSIKPSQRLFREALAHFPPQSRVLFAGDSIDRDIIPAKALGLGTVWIAPAGSAHASADRVVASLTDIVRL